MPIVICSNCSAKLNVRDTAAGKKVRCPECQTVCAVPAPAPAFEVVEHEPEPKPKPIPRAAPSKANNDALPQRKRNPSEGEDDEDDMDDDRPRKKKGNTDKPTTEKSRGLLIGGIAVGVLLLVGGSFAAYWFGFRDNAEGTNDDITNNAATINKGATNNVVTKKANDPDAKFEKHLDDMKQGKGRDYTYKDIGEMPVREDRRAEVAKLLENRLFQKDFDDLSKGYAAKALGKWGTKENVPALLRALEASDGSVILNGVIPALVAIKDPTAIKPLVEKFEKFELMRGTLAPALRAFGTDAVPTISTLLDHRDHITRNAARRLLLEMGAKVEDRIPKTPSDWAEYKPMKGGFHILMPERGTVTGIALTPEQKGIVIAANERRANDYGYIYVVVVVRFRSDATESDRQSVMDSMTGSNRFVTSRVKLTSRDKITWAGRDALEHRYSFPDICMSRQMHTASFGYAAGVFAPTGELDGDLTRLFLNSFTFDME